MNPADRIDYVLTSDPFTLIIGGGLLFLFAIFLIEAAIKR